MYWCLFGHMHTALRYHLLVRCGHDRAALQKRFIPRHTMFRRTMEDIKHELHTYLSPAEVFTKHYTQTFDWQTCTLRDEITAVYDASRESGRINLWVFF